MKDGQDDRVKSLRKPIESGRSPQKILKANSSYEAVGCFYCAKPIRLPPTLLRLLAAEPAAEPAGAPESQSQTTVFLLRCAACGKENRYVKGEIKTVEGGPGQVGDLYGFGVRRYVKA